MSEDINPRDLTYSFASTIYSQGLADSLERRPPANAPQLFARLQTVTNQVLMPYLHKTITARGVDHYYSWQPTLLSFSGERISEVNLRGTAHLLVSKDGSLHEQVFSQALAKTNECARLIADEWGIAELVRGLPGLLVPMSRSMLTLPGWQLSHLSEYTGLFAEHLPKD